MSPNATPPEGLYGRESVPEAGNASGALGGETRPQAGAEGLDGVEIHHWDAEKTAEVARLLAEHPPRDYTITTTVGQTGQADETPPAVHPRARCRCGHARDLHNDTDCAGCTHAGLNHLARHAFIAREDQL